MLLTMKYKISLVGSFGFGKELRDGQTVKTIEYAKLLESVYGAGRINRVDTNGWHRSPLKLLSHVVEACRCSEIVIMLPAQNALRVIPCVAMLAKRKGVRFFYAVIGGWLPEFLRGKPVLAKILQKMDGIWVETRRMKSALAASGFSNVHVVPNFKDLAIIGKEELAPYDSPVLRLCIFSRVQKQKGITFAAEALAEVNAMFGKRVCLLDIYGPVSEDYRAEFEAICRKYDAFVSYKGVIDPDRSTTVVKDYFALLFPTLYPTEGVPGTIIDAYSAGVPVISARWQNFSEMVDDGTTGYGFELGNRKDLIGLLTVLCNNPDKINSLKLNCLVKATEFSASKAAGILQKQLEAGSEIRLPQ